MVIIVRWNHSLTPVQRVIEISAQQKDTGLQQLHGTSIPPWTAKARVPTYMLQVSGEGSWPASAVASWLAGRLQCLQEGHRQGGGGGGGGRLCDLSRFSQTNTPSYNRHATWITYYKPRHFWKQYWLQHLLGGNVRPRILFCVSWSDRYC